MKSFLIQLYVTCLGVGKLPKMPGTWGTLAGIPVLLIFWQLEIKFRIPILILSTLVTIYIVNEYERLNHRHDSQEVVIDEVLGLLFTGLMLEFSAVNVVSCFCIFRFFDIFKPFPINVIDKKMPGGWGTVLDDVIAGVFACVAIQISIGLMG